MFKSYINKYARLTRALAIVILIVHFALGIFMLANDFDDHFLPFIFSVSMFVVVAVLMFGFAEIIETLYRMYKRQELSNGKTLPDKPTETELE